MIKRVLSAVIAIFILGAAAAITVFAAAFALYAVLKPLLGEPGAAAVVAGVAALLVAICGLILGSAGKGGPRLRRPPPEPTMGEKLGQLARERPILAAVAALGAGLIALRNPQAAAGIISAFLAGKASDKNDNRRRR